MERRVAENAQKYFVTGISLITSTGSLGQNIMAAEWTMQISYAPLLIAVFIHESAATFRNIKESKEFGVNVASDDQASLVNIAGGYSRFEIDKIKIKNLFSFIRSRQINAPMIAGCIVNAECKLLAMKNLGDHTMFVGRVVAIKHDKTKRPLIYHTGKYYKIGPVMPPIRETVRLKSKEFNSFLTEAKGRFVLKCVGIIIKSGEKTLVLQNPVKKIQYYTIPFMVASRGSNHKKEIERYLKKLGLKVVLKEYPIVKRLTLKNGKKSQRVNFVLFEGNLKGKLYTQVNWKAIKSDPLLRAIVN